MGNGVRQFSSTDDLRTLLNEWKSGVSDDRFRSQTRLVDAMLATRMVFPADKARRIVLLTDGQETEREIAPAVLKQLGEEGIDVQLAPIAGLAHAEAATISLEPSSTDSFYGEMLRMTVKLAANQPIGAKLRLIHNGVAVQQKDLRLDPAQQNVAKFDAEMTTTGTDAERPELVPDDDHFPINNVVTCTINVRGRPRVLVLHQKPQVLRRSLACSKNRT